MAFRVMPTSMQKYATARHDPKTLKYYDMVKATGSEPDLEIVKKKEHDGISLDIQDQEENQSE